MGRGYRLIFGASRTSTAGSRYQRRKQDSGFAKLMTLNTHRVFTLTQKCLPLLRAAAVEGGKDVTSHIYQDPARIINVRRSVVTSKILPPKLTVLSRLALSKALVCQITKRTATLLQKQLFITSAVTLLAA
jgi:hypothetical protein